MLPPHTHTALKQNLANSMCPSSVSLDAGGDRHTVQAEWGCVLQNESSERLAKGKQTEMPEVNRKDDSKVSRAVSTPGPS